jgi:ribosomal protein S27AE
VGTAIRNPLFVPDAAPSTSGTRTACPSCGQGGFTGKRIAGAVRFSCGSCGAVWTGGIPGEPSPVRPVGLPPSPISIVGMDIIAVKADSGHVSFRQVEVYSRGELEFKFRTRVRPDQEEGEWVNDW